MAHDAPAILLRGSPRWARLLLDELIATGRPARIIPWRHAVGIPYLFCIRFGRLPPRAGVFHQVMVHLRTPLTAAYFRAARARGLATIAHWIGSDVVWLKERLAVGKPMPRFLREVVDRHLCDSPKLQAELRDCGIEADVLRLLPRSIDAETMPLPSSPAVLAYIRKGHERFCGLPVVEDMARRFPAVEFLIVAHDGAGLPSSPPNVRFLGMVAGMDRVYARTTALVRICDHDSLSVMVLEALARGRYVIYSEPCPGTIHATDAASAYAALNDILNRTAPNDVGAAYVREYFNWREEITKLTGIYDELLSSRRGRSVG